MSIEKVITGESQTEYIKYPVLMSGNKENPGDEKVETKSPYLKNSEKNYLDKIFVDRAIENLEKASDIFNLRLSFRVDEETNRIVVKVIDTETDKVIKEIPPEQIVELAAKIREMIGLLVDEER